MHTLTEKQDSINTSKVLIADDDEATRILLRMALTQWGYEVIEAKDGEEAWNILLQPNPPHILTLDWLMPKLDGISLCKRVENELDFHPYIIFLTRMTGTENMMQGLEAGADEFVLKPFDLTELRIRIFAGERIIKYRHQLAEQNKQLQNYAAKMHEFSKEHASNILSFPDLISLLQETRTALNMLHDSAESPKIHELQTRISNFLNAIKTISSPSHKIQHVSDSKTASHSVPAEPIVQETESIVNMQRMQAFFGNNIPAIKDFIKTFISLSSDQVKEIGNAIKNKDNKSAKYLFHLLGSASGNSGMMKMYDTCGIGEEKATQSDWDAAEECYHSLKSMLNKLEIEVQNEFKAEKK